MIHLLKLLVMIPCTLFFLAACSDTNQPISDEDTIQKALLILVDSLDSTPIDTSALSLKIRLYVEAHSDLFFGATVAVLDSQYIVQTSPYWYRGTNGLQFVNLAADTSYHINKQDWLVKPLALGNSVWSIPYFDAGGGEIWMRTLSIPVRYNGKIIAIATTDMKTVPPKSIFRNILGD